VEEAEPALLVAAAGESLGQRGAEDEREDDSGQDDEDPDGKRNQDDVEEALRRETRDGRGRRGLRTLASFKLPPRVLNYGTVIFWGAYKVLWTVLTQHHHGGSGIAIDKDSKVIARFTAGNGARLDGLMKQSQ